MMIPSPILALAAGLMLVVAVVSAGRLALGRPWRRSGQADIDGAHLLMGIAMAGMLVAGLRTLPDQAWIVLFIAMTGWFAGHIGREWRDWGTRVLADSHYAPHLMHSAAMIYMFAAVAAPAAAHGPGMAGMAGGAGGGLGTLGAPVLAFLFAIVLAGYSVLDLGRISGPAPYGRRLLAAGIMPAGSAGAGLAASANSGPVVSAGATLVASGRGAGSVRGLLLSPRVGAACRTTMGVIMAGMLISMI
jgi:hypothetical protein